ncbi:hypothetical protein BV898_14334 [Hypsibius exemplaris]|uniref:Uncharacterized protein n=1 Tax=Hypsibius exemplaris TaxID=2072580 RepID=A0A9X6N9N6_HYPEX|nr:hypothetical protein BV898_14334 [Hypsibius exemplaris]
MTTGIAVINRAKTGLSMAQRLCRFPLSILLRTVWTTATHLDEEHIQCAQRKAIRVLTNSSPSFHNTHHGGRVESTANTKIGNGTIAERFRIIFKKLSQSFVKNLVSAIV